MHISGSRFGRVQNDDAIGIDEPDPGIQVNAESLQVRADSGKFLLVILLFKIISHILVGHVDSFLIKGRRFFPNHLVHDQLGSDRGNQEKTADTENQEGEDVFLGQ